jgi:hypothetical protein
MFLTVHAAAGIIIGEQTNNVWLAFALGLVSHLLLDLIPQCDENLVTDKNKKRWIMKYFIISVIDTIGVIVLSYWLWKYNHLQFTWPTMVAVAGALIPDYLWGLAEFTGSKTLLVICQKFFSWFHDFVKTKISVPQGFLVQIITLIIFVLILIY